MLVLFTRFFARAYVIDNIPRDDAEELWDSLAQCQGIQKAVEFKSPTLLVELESLLCRYTAMIKGKEQHLRGVMRTLLGCVR